MVNIIVAIDGPTGTGKSTTARLLADKLGLKYIDSGAMYRIITYELLKNHIKPNEIRRIVDIAKRLQIEFENEDVKLNGEIINNEIRSFEVTNKVSSVSKIRQIREIIIAKQREYTNNCGVVMDGRDIGTVVFPQADFKFFLICDLNTRAARRQQDFLDLGIKIPIDKIITEIQKRDEMDTTRKISPLIMAKDAAEVDTTNMIIEEQVDFLYRKIISSPDYK